MKNKRSKKFHAQGIAKYCAMSKRELMDLCDFYTVNDSGSYMGIKNNGGNILAVAHVDYHCTGKVHMVSKKRVQSSALDDRAGCYIALNMLEEYGITADVLLTDDEEIGLSTIDMFGQGNLQKYNWIVQLDRRGEGCVVYGFQEMKQHVQKYFTVHNGSYSDICELEEVSPVSAFNMGVGYYNEHSETCHIDMSALFRQMGRLSQFYKEYGAKRIGRPHSPIEMVQRSFRRKDYYYYPNYADNVVRIDGDNDADMDVLDMMEQRGYTFFPEDDYYVDPKGNIKDFQDINDEPLIDWTGTGEVFDDPDDLRLLRDSGMLYSPQDRWEE